MKTYIVTRGTGGQVGCLVKRTGVDAGRHNSGCRILANCGFHSPDGFETGYAGSGPADLALSILIDFFGEDPSTAAQRVRESSWLHPAPKKVEKAWRLHQTFKENFITTARIEPGQHYEIPGDAIERWIADCEVAA